MKTWILFGLIWGTFMTLIMNIAVPLWNDEELNPLKIILSIPVWIGVGIFAGYISRKKKPKNQIED